jgi:Undecaprenyl-phosphate glucose phosphotransferase
LTFRSFDAEERRSSAVDALFTRRGFSIVMAGAEAAAITALAVACGVGYSLVAYGEPGPIGSFVEIGAFAGFLFVALSIAQGQYAIERFLTWKGHIRRTVYNWCVVFLGLLAVGFLTKWSGSYSRGTVVIFFLAGILMLWRSRLGLVRLVTAWSRSGHIEGRRVLLVGSEGDVAEFAARHRPWEVGIDIVGAAALDPQDSPHFERDLDAAVLAARAVRPDDVFIVMPWSRTREIDRTVEALMNAPVAIHLAPERILDRYDAAAIAKIGPIASLELCRPPFTTVEVLAKRVLDVGLAAVGLVLLAPLFLVVAALIKIDSRGPVFFLQQRSGFNQRTFRIVKFRSMTTLDDGKHVAQVTRGDPRVTRVGAFLRRTNIDELPQLLNVLRGEMSIVGPRPHAVAHNRAFERRIAAYARRHNVKPGITGWAQVNGWRGETDTDEKMRARVEHDLWYIDNWSLALDLRILVLTAFSRKAFRNAY